MEFSNRLFYILVFSFVFFLVSIQVFREETSFQVILQPQFVVSRDNFVNGSEFIQDRIRSIHATNDVTGHTFKILQYTGFFTYFLKQGGTLFAGCEFTNCEITHNKGEILQSDAILFHLRTIRSLPVKRLPNQKWIAVTRESPVHNNVPQKYSDLFNATATYSRRSDIEFEYGWTIKSGNMPTDRKLHASSKKTKMAAWIVSNCKTPSKREAYVKELQKYINGH